MNERGAKLLITDMAQGRIWEAERDLELVRYTDADGSSYLAPAQEAVFEDMRSTVAPPTRRTPRERLEATMQPLVADALASYKATGRIVWPRSAETALAHIAMLIHDPTITDDTGGAEQVIRQGKALALYITETGEMQQKHQDSKKTTLDWAGH